MIKLIYAVISVVAVGWVDVPVVTDIPVTNSYSDVNSRLPLGHPYNDSDKITSVHECTHGVNSRLRMVHGKPSFYVLDGQAFTMPELGGTLRDVALRVPKSLRGDIYNLYLINNRDWNNIPSYIFDEAVAYGNGCVARDDFKISDRQETIQYAIEFNIYASYLPESIEAKSFNNWLLVRNIWYYIRLQKKIEYIERSDVQARIQYILGQGKADYVFYTNINKYKSLKIYKDGTLIFWDGGFLVQPINNNTGSTLTHVAIIFNDTVYEATWPRVHKVPINDYINHLEYLKTQPLWKQRNFKYYILEPKVPFHSSYVKAMVNYAESQMGRPYMLRGWWRGREVRGIFCSQYVGNILEKSKILKSANYQESPISLYNKVKPYYAKNK